MTLDAMWTRFALNVVVGTVAGGVTNAVAVWMLFHPYERRYGFHGAIPKNKARLAKAIGRTVGERLLTPDDIIAELHRAGLRETIDAKLATFIDSLLEKEWGTLRSIVPEPLLAELAPALDTLAPRLADAASGYAAGPGFEADILAFVRRARAELAPLSVGAVLTPERREQLAAQAAILASELVEESRRQDGRGVRARLGDWMLKLAGTERTQQFVERAVHDALARAEGRTWGELLEPLEDATIAGWILDAARSARATTIVRDAAGGAARALLDVPLGRPARFLPPDAGTRLAARAAPALWSWMEEQLPKALAQIDVEGVVERKVLGFSTQRVEEIVRNVTQRELDLIVNLGYVLGAVIGLMTFGISEAIARF